MSYASNLTSLKFLNIIIVLLLLVLFGHFQGCTEVSSQNNQLEKYTDPEFNKYWYAGEAELTRYKLEQARYGEIHDGDAVLIFVTEDFDTENLVKFEGGNKNEKVKSTLKLNYTKKFNTGIYPYSMMSSIFSPVDGSKALKVTTTSQEWCGHTFSQLNLRKNKYEGNLYSYFQREGDQEFSLKSAMLEDEIWTRIRINPASLPTGKIQLIPGTQFLRLKHRDHQVEQAMASKEETEDESLSEKTLIKYKIAYSGFERILEITFEKRFPHSIVAWEEHGQSGFGHSKPLITRAVKTHQIKSAYWGQNGVADGHLRETLGLE